MVRVNVWLEEQMVERIQSFTVLMLKKIYEQKSWEVQGSDKEIKYKRKKIDVPFTLSLKHLFIM